MGDLEKGPERKVQSEKPRSQCAAEAMENLNPEERAEACQETDEDLQVASERLISLREVREKAKEKEVKELIDSTPDLNPVEKFFLANVDELAGTAPDLIRMLPLIKSGNFESLGKGLSQSENIQKLFDSMKAHLLNDKELRQEFFASLRTMIQKDVKEELLAEYKGSLAEGQVDGVVKALDDLIANPENQEPLINALLDQKNLPTLLSGEMNWEDMKRIASGVDKAWDEVLLGAFEGAKMWGADVVNDGLNTVKGWANEATRYFGYEFEVQEKLDLGKEDVPDFISKPENAEKLAAFLEANQDVLKGAGRDLPVLYLGVKAIVNNDLDNPAIKALTENKSLTELMGKLREFVGKEPEFREELLKNAEAGVLAALKTISPNPDATDWGAVGGEIKDLISASPEFQENFLDFAFLQFEKGPLIEAIQGKGEPTEIAGEILKVPFVKTLAGNLSDKQKTPQLRNLIAEIGVNAGFNYAGEQLKDNLNYKVLEGELKKLAQDPELQDALFNMLSSENSAELLQTFQEVQNGNLENLSKLLKNENAKVILEKAGGFLSKNPKAQKVVFDQVLAQDERLKPLEGFLQRDPDGMQAVFELAANPDELGKVVDTLDPVLKELEKEAPDPNVILSHAEKLLGNPKIKKLVENLAADFQKNPDAWKGQVDQVVDQVIPSVQKSVRDSLADFLPADSLGAVDKALESAGQVLKSDPGLQNSLVDFAKEPKNIATIQQILKAKDNPVQLINTVGSNPALVGVIGQMRTVLLKDSAVRESLTTAVLEYMDNVKKLGAASSAPTESASGGSESKLVASDDETNLIESADISPEQILDAILANKGIKDLVDSTVDQIAERDNPGWKDAREKMFKRGTETAIKVTRNILKKFKIDDQKWNKVEGALVKFMGENQNVQLALLNLAKDFKTAKKFMHLGETRDFSLIDNPEVKKIMAEVAKFFTESPDTWNTAVNMTAETVIDTGLAGETENMKRKLKQDVADSNLNPSIINPETIKDIIEDLEDMEGAGNIRTGWNGITIAGHLGLDREKLAATIFNPFNHFKIFD